jgi:hypothetical protein
MLKVENTEVFGWEATIRGMRNPMNSWHLSDSFEHTANWELYRFGEGNPEIGEKDLKLMQNLSKAGDDHGKFLRYINVTVDITAPLYWWKEFDTYKVGTVANSCSTMHKIHAKEFELDDFSHEHLMNWEHDGELCGSWLDTLKETIRDLNIARKYFLETKDKEYWWQMIQLLPSSYNQKRTVQLNYQVLKTMYFARRNHKLDEWHTLCEWMESLPYFKEICIQE